MIVVLTSNSMLKLILLVVVVVQSVKCNLIITQQLVQHPQVDVLSRKWIPMRSYRPEDTANPEKSGEVLGTSESKVSFGQHQSGMSIPATGEQQIPIDCGKISSQEVKFRCESSQKRTTTAPRQQQPDVAESMQLNARKMPNNLLMGQANHDRQPAFKFNRQSDRREIESPEDSEGNTAASETDDDSNEDDQPNPSDLGNLGDQRELQQDEEMAPKESAGQPRSSDGMYPSLNQQFEPEPDENAERREQEAAEASEADAANKSALDEQQQAQREIIMQQAQSEAKAIKAQQEALMMQQRLQQQMLLKRQNELTRGDPYNTRGSGSNNESRTKRPKKAKKLEQRYMAEQSSLSPRSRDNQFSDQLDREQQAGPLTENASEPDGRGDDIRSNYNLGEASENSDRKPEYTQLDAQSEPRSELDSKLLTSSDLLPAAQHHYGAHYGSMHGHHKDYYQFAESHKKGQFDSGFKRGGKKFQISGHSSQHKSHAEGHVKWNGKKGKGSQYWDLKHKDQKHYGHYGGHH